MSFVTSLGGLKQGKEGKKVTVQVSVPFSVSSGPANTVDLCTVVKT